MSKIKWVLGIALIAVVSYLLISKLFPAVGEGIDAALGPSVTGFFNDVYLGITTHPIWVNFNSYIILGAGLFFGALLVWKGRNTVDSIRGVARIRATDQPVVSPSTSTPISSTPLTATTRPTVSAEQTAPVTPVVEEPKK